MVLFAPPSQGSVSSIWKQFSRLNIFRHCLNSCSALSLKIGPEIFHLLTRKKQMKNRLAMEKIKITGVSIWLKCSRLINPKQPRTTNIINQSHGRLLFPPKFWLTIPEMVKRSPQSLYFNMGNLTLGVAMSGFDDFAISMPRKRIN